MAITGRIVRSADFERVLGAVATARSEHFAVHHLPGTPSLPAKPSKKCSSTELSTEEAPVVVVAVDDFQSVPLSGGEARARFWVGLVVPKRHARRSVTRSLFKRQIRAAMARHALTLACGLWVVRLRAPFENAKYPSAASSALQRAARDELDGLLVKAAKRASAPAARAVAS